jgi:hypothetical protein
MPSLVRLATRLCLPTKAKYDVSADLFMISAVGFFLASSSDEYPRSLLYAADSFFYPGLLDKARDCIDAASVNAADTQVSDAVILRRAKLNLHRALQDGSVDKMMALEEIRRLRSLLDDDATNDSLASIEADIASLLSQMGDIVAARRHVEACLTREPLRPQC